MSTRRFIFGEVSLATAFLLGAAAVSGQTNPGETRPRALTNNNIDSVSTAEATQPEVGTPEANAKAKELYKTGVKYGKAGLFTQAADTFRLALTLKPDYADAYRSLGHAYLELNQLEQAVQSLEQALMLDPKDKDARRLIDEAWNKVTIAANAEPAGLVAKKPTPSTSATPSPPVSRTEPALTSVYRVGPGDVLDLLVGATQSAESTATINSSGLLVHSSLAEPLPVANLTVEEINSKLQSVLKQKVSVGIRDYVSHTILVSGLVKEPGTKILRREAIPLSVVVADAQPLPEAGRVAVFRNRSNESYTVDLEQTAEMNMLVQPGDVVTLQATPTQFFYVAGEVKAPGEKIFRSNLTLTQAIITAGGPIKKPKEARLSRDNGKGFLIVTRYNLKEIDAGRLPDPMIQPGDRITIMN